MHLDRQIFGGVVVVAVAEPMEIDIGNADEFKEQSLRLIGEANRVVLDASRVEFFDSAGMGALLSLQRRIAARSGALVLCGLARPVQEVFRMVGFDVVFLWFPDLPAALMHFEE